MRLKRFAEKYTLFSPETIHYHNDQRFTIEAFAYLRHGIIFLKKPQHGVKTTKQYVPASYVKAISWVLVHNILILVSVRL